MPEPFSVDLRVRYVECDMQGHVFSGHYLTWFDLAHTELLRAATGLAYPDLVARDGFEVVVAESNVRYLAPARYDDALAIEVVLDPPTTSSLTSRFTIRRGDAVITQGFLRHVCVDAKAYTKMPWPAAVRDALAPYVAASATTPSRPT
jgi:acyl-CoA thioester hydrolase